MEYILKEFYSGKMFVLIGEAVKKYLQRPWNKKVTSWKNRAECYQEIMVVCN